MARQQLISEKQRHLIFLMCKVSSYSCINVDSSLGDKEGNLEECNNWLPFAYNDQNLLPHDFIQEMPFAALGYKSKLLFTACTDLL